MDKPKLILVDATGFCYRAFYALKGLETSFGQPTNAVYGFISMLQKILKEEKPDFIAVCFDISRDTFRQKKFADYKINRPPMPDGLKSQLPLIKEIIGAYGISMLEKEGYEADDIIATVATKASTKGIFVEIVSSDKDILQLIDDNILVLSPSKDANVIYDKDAVKERFGVSPQQIVDMLALSGDDTDNIPGVLGVGAKTAGGLITDFGSLEEILNNMDRIKSEKLRNTLADNIEKIKLSRELASLEKEVNIDFDLMKLKIGQPDFKELYRLFKHLEFKKLLQNLPVEAVAKQINNTTLKDRDLQDLKLDNNELFLFGWKSEEIIFYANNIFIKLADPGKNFKMILSDCNIKKIGYDLKRLKVELANENIGLEGVYFDVMVAAYLLNPSKTNYSLVDIAWDYLGHISTAKEIDNENAVDLIKELRPRLQEQLRDKSLLNLFFDMEMPLVEVLAEMELNGIKLDLSLLKKLSVDIEQRLAKLIEDIYDISGSQFNINSPKQLRQVLFDKLKLPVIKRSKTGPSTDEEVLRSLSSKHKLPARLLEYRQLTKLKNTYIDILPDLVNQKTQRVHTRFNQTATETGRLSSANPNLQNIPVKTEIGRNIRRAIIAEGHGDFLLSCDYSQIELRILAHLSKDDNLISAFKENSDIHKTTASLIYGLSEKDIDDSMREVAKRINFGIIYGLSAYGLSRDLGITIDEAERFIDAYFLRYPKVKEYIHRQIAKAAELGFVTTILGRRRYIPEIKNKNQGIRQFAQRQAVNTPIQGSASDLIKLAMIEIDKQIKKSGIRTKMILQIHDELVFEVPGQEIKEVINLAKVKMESVMQLDVPITVVIKKGKNWLEMEEVR